MSEASPLLSLRHITKSPGGRRVLESLDLEIHPGETVAVLGPSGSGKSVLLKLVLGILRPDLGEIEYGWGRGTSRRFSAVFQGDALFDELTVLDNVAFPAIRSGASRADALVRAREALAEVGLGSGVEERQIRSLSGGMRKRVALARATLVDSPLLILDEPTSGLDGDSSLAVVEAVKKIRRLRPEGGCLVVTHDVAVARALGNRCLRLDPELGHLVPWSPDSPASFGPVSVRPGEPAAASAVSEGVRALARMLSASLTSLAQLRPPLVSEVLKRLAPMALGALPIMVVSGLLMGAISCLQLGQGFDFLEYYDDIPGMLGSGLSRMLAPLFGGLFLAARVGAAIGAEFSVKEFTEQKDALETMGVRAAAWWLSPLLAAVVLLFPVMIAVFAATFLVGSGLTFSWALHQPWRLFTSQVLVPEFWSQGLLSLVRTMIAGGLTAFLTYQTGLTPKSSSRDIGLASTRSVVVGLMVVVVVELVFLMAT